MAQRTLFAFFAPKESKRVSAPATELSSSVEPSSSRTEQESMEVERRRQKRQKTKKRPREDNQRKGEADDQRADKDDQAEQGEGVDFVVDVSDEEKDVAARSDMRMDIDKSVDGQEEEDGDDGGDDDDDEGDEGDDDCPSPSKKMKRSDHDDDDSSPSECTSEDENSQDALKSGALVSVISSKVAEAEQEIEALQREMQAKEAEWDAKLKEVLDDLEQKKSSLKVDLERVGEYDEPPLGLMNVDAFVNNVRDFFQHDEDLSGDTFPERFNDVLYAMALDHPSMALENLVQICHAFLTFPYQWNALFDASPCGEIFRAVRQTLSGASTAPKTVTEKGIHDRLVALVVKKSAGKRSFWDVESLTVIRHADIRSDLKSRRLQRSTLQKKEAKFTSDLQKIEKQIEKEVRDNERDKSRAIGVFGREIGKKERALEKLRMKEEKDVERLKKLKEKEKMRLEKEARRKRKAEEKEREKELEREKRQKEKEIRAKEKERMMEEEKQKKMEEQEKNKSKNMEMFWRRVGFREVKEDEENVENVSGGDDGDDIKVVDSGMSGKTIKSVEELMAGNGATHSRQDLIQKLRQLSKVTRPAGYMWRKGKHVKYFHFKATGHKAQYGKSRDESGRVLMNPRRPFAQDRIVVDYDAISEASSSEEDEPEDGEQLDELSDMSSLGSDDSECREDFMVQDSDIEADCSFVREDNRGFKMLTVPPFKLNPQGLDPLPKDMRALLELESFVECVLKEDVLSAEAVIQKVKREYPIVGKVIADEELQKLVEKTNQRVISSSKGGSKDIVSMFSRTDVHDGEVHVERILEVIHQLDVPGVANALQAFVRLISSVSKQKEQDGVEEVRKAGDDLERDRVFLQLEFCTRTIGNKVIEIRSQTYALQPRAMKEEDLNAIISALVIEDKAVDQACDDDLVGRCLQYFGTDVRPVLIHLLHAWSISWHKAVKRVPDLLRSSVLPEGFVTHEGMLNHPMIVWSAIQSVKSPLVTASNAEDCVRFLIHLATKTDGIESFLEEMLSEVVAAVSFCVSREVYSISSFVKRIVEKREPVFLSALKVKEREGGAAVLCIASIVRSLRAIVHSHSGSIGTLPMHVFHAKQLLDWFHRHFPSNATSYEVDIQ
eukprot:TRINITY_DN909_c0_g5_i1.p1 TRINITY_DN909_c0_g5~~TRINITY_DN909_c0_g5_i1.p1  ORF type:complete len:1119 (+),score=420.17 TRINITY_DN909_c0_g5_i1:86-3442(+)